MLDLSIINLYLTCHSIILKLINMKLVVRFILLLGLILIGNTGFAASSSVLNRSIESTTEKQSFKERTKVFYQKQIVQRVKKKVKKVKDSWRLYKESKKKGFGLPAFILLLTATFVTLQLTGVIMWSWIWVLSPLWIPIALFILLFLVALIGVSAMKR